MDTVQAARRILVVDDEEDTLVLTEAMLTARGYQVVLARSGAAALDALREGADAVLLDVMMPEMSGLEVLSRMRDTPRLAGIPVILLTARQGDRDVLDGYCTGADYYITKPCTVDQIVYGLSLVCSPLRATAKSFSKVPHPSTGTGSG